MKAIVYHRYGAPEEVLGLEDVDIPLFGDQEVLVRVYASGLNPADWHFMRGEPLLARASTGIRRPRHPTVVGSDVAGKVEAVGRRVTRFRPGDDVYGEVGFGGCAEFVGCDAAELSFKPANLSFEEAAAVPMAATTALVGIRDKCRVGPGSKVLVNGASGGVGTYAVQIAKALGAEVTAVCGPRNVALVRSLGADHVVDYSSEDFAQSDVRYDAMLDMVGNRSLADCRRVLAPGGTYGAVGGGGGHWLGPFTQQLRAMATAPFVTQRMVPVNDRPNYDLTSLTGFIESGTLRPIIDRTYQLSETAAAVSFLEGGHVAGKVVVSVLAAI